jgi:agmatinase
VLLGGEHTITYGALDALKEAHGEFGIVQFDAHADLRDSYAGNTWSHACVMRRAVENLKLPLAQFGVRALCAEEDNFRRQHGIITHDAAKLARNGLPAQPFSNDFPEKIYITFDIDALDASLMPATGTPVPGGLGWYQALDLVALVLRGRRAIGFDVVEFAPIAGLHAPNFTAAQLVYSLMGLVI